MAPSLLFFLLFTNNFPHYSSFFPNLYLNVILSLFIPPVDYLKFSSDYSHAVAGSTGSARGMRSASELRDLMDTLQRKKIALENSLRANGNTNPSYFSVTQVSHHLAPLFYYSALYVMLQLGLWSLYG